MTESSSAPVEVTTSGFIAVAGRPNAGKSTLVNHVVGQHVAIVSPIAQTTRRIVRAVARRGHAQYIFVDLPGSQKPMDRMTSRMQRSVERAFDDVDMVLWVIDGGEELGKSERVVRDLIYGANLPVVIALNKVDLTKREVIATRITEIVELLEGREFAALVPISARTGDGVDDLLDELATHLPDGPAWFGDEDVVDMRDEERIAEYVREATLAHLREELPHATAVTVDDMLPDENGRVRVSCTIWVDNDSQVGIVVGKGGERIREVGIAARTKIEEQLGLDHHLDLRVKTRKNWRDDEQWLARAGL